MSLVNIVPNQIQLKLFVDKKYICYYVSAWCYENISANKSVVQSSVEWYHFLTFSIWYYKFRTVFGTPRNLIMLELHQENCIVGTKHISNSTAPNFGLSTI